MRWNDDARICITPLLEKFIMKQIKDYSKNDFKDLVTKIVKDGQVVLHEQELTQQELTQVCEKMGYTETNDYFMNPKDAQQLVLCLVN